MTLYILKIENTTSFCHAVDISTCQKEKKQSVKHLKNSD